MFCALYDKEGYRDGREGIEIPVKQISNIGAIGCSIYLGYGSSMSHGVTIFVLTLSQSCNRGIWETSSELKQIM